jgi:hypothetical protein
MRRIKLFQNFEISESSNSRIYNWFNYADCAILTAFRGNLRRDENIKRNGELKKILMGKGYYLTEIKGVYIENYKRANPKEVLENSFLVCNSNQYNGFKSFMIDLGKKYDQDSVLICPREGKNAFLYGTNYTGYPGMDETEDVGNLKMKKDGEFYSRKSGGIIFTFSKEAPIDLNWIKIK